MKNKDTSSGYEKLVAASMIKILGKKNIDEIMPGDQVEKKMTVLFSDIRDFTTISESMSPNDTFTYINTYLGRMSPAIIENGGIIDKYIGDAIMALFPSSTDHSLTAAIDMIKRLKALNRENEKRDMPPVRIGVGLNTGIIMLGTIGGVGRVEGTVIGDAVNLASRLESLTKIYDVPLIIGEETYYSLDHPENFHIRFLDRIKVKGKSHSESIYEVYDHEPEEVKIQKRDNQQIYTEALAAYHMNCVDMSEKLLNQCLVSCNEDCSVNLYLERCRKTKESGLLDSSGEIGINITWHHEFEIGHPVVDSQHRELLESINHFLGEFKRDAGHEIIKKEMDSLKQFVTLHFNSEEELMKKIGYPFLHLQEIQHRKFIETFSRLRKDILKSDGDSKLFLIFKIHVFLLDWLINHTTKSDRHIGKYIRYKNL